MSNVTNKWAKMQFNKIKNWIAKSLKTITKLQWLLLFFSAIFLPVSINILGILTDVENKEFIKFLSGNLSRFGIPFDPRKQILLAWIINFSLLGILVIWTVLVSKTKFLQKTHKLIKLILLGILSLITANLISGWTLLVSTGWANVFFEGPLGLRMSSFMVDSCRTVLPKIEFGLLFITYLLNPSKQTDQSPTPLLG